MEEALRRPVQRIRIKRKVDAWLGTMLYHSARGQVDSSAFGRQLQSIVGPAIRPQAIQQTFRDAVGQVAPGADDLELKGRVLARCTPQRMAEQISFAQEALAWRPLAQKGKKPQTIGEVIQGWAELTGQSPAEFEQRVYPKLKGLLQDWRRKTRCLGLTDEEVFGRPKEAATFLAGFWKVLIEETPEANLAELGNTACTLIAKTPTSKLQAQFHDLLGQASEFTAWRASRETAAALEANPKARVALSTPEVAALVRYEEQKQGWGDAHQAIELLETSLASELQDRTRGRPTKTLILNVLRSAARRSLLSNLRDAVNGQLRGRLVETALRWVEKEGAQVATHWEFPESPLEKQNMNGIRRWLFRR